MYWIQIPLSLTYKDVTITQPTYLHNVNSFNPLQYPLLPFINHQPSLDWKSQITQLDMHHLSLETTSKFISRTYE